MADKTFGVKVSEEIHDRVKEMIEASGISAKEWFEKAVAVTEMNAIKQGATDYSQDLSELEVHTTRIYELVANMVQRSIYIKDHAVKEISDKLEQREAIISEYQEKAKAAIEEAKQSKELADSTEKEKQDLIKQLDELRSIHTNNQLLIDQYKDKNDTLSGLVTKYQAFAEENEQLKKEFEKERQQLQSQVNEVSSQADDQADEIKDLKREIDSLKVNHVNELERLTEKKEYEKDKAVLEVERSFQDKLLKANEAYNDKIKALYDEMAAIRKEYEEKLVIAQTKQDPQNPTSKK